LKNDGTVHEKAKGAITISNTFGKTVGTLQVNERGGNILPDSIRRFEQGWPAKQLFGRYTAKLDMTYADSRKISSTLVFWVIPWRMVLLGVIGLVALFFVLRLALHRYNEHIIAQARRS
jgi:hypothetical protein